MTLPDSFPPSERVAEYLAREHGLKGVLGFRVLGDGLAPPVLVEHNRRAWILRSHAANDTDLVAALARGVILATASSRGAPISKLQLSETGEPVHVETVDGRSYALMLFEKVDGRLPQLEKHTFRKIGAQLARFHAAMTSETPADLPVLGCNSLLNEPADAIRPQLIRGDWILARATALLRPVVEEFESTLPIVICHGDAHHHNSLVGPSGDVVFFDFEHLCRGWAAFDLATLLWGTLGDDAGPAVWSAAVEGYSSVRPLTNAEAAAIAPLMACRHLWWLGMHARHWGRWQRPWMTRSFFDDSVDMVRRLLVDACGAEWTHPAPR
jgi:Ser/Thr protein kinase RdoA (MazF antagonist)